MFSLIESHPTSSTFGRGHSDQGECNRKLKKQLNKQVPSVHLFCIFSSKKIKLGNFYFIINTSNESPPSGAHVSGYGKW